MPWAFSSPDCRGGTPAPPLQGLSRGDPQGLRGESRNVFQVRGNDEDHRLPDGLSRGEQDHRPPQANAIRGETSSDARGLSGSFDGH